MLKFKYALFSMYAFPFMNLKPLREGGHGAAQVRTPVPDNDAV